MGEKKLDRRVRYTKMVIKDSFIQLLKQKPISKISIKEICDGADINRATFYTHYMDQNDLLYQIENELIDEINNYIGSYDFRASKEAPTEMLIKILDFVKENVDIFDLLLNSNGDIKFQKEVTYLIGNQHFFTSNTDSEVMNETSEYIFLFCANGCIGIIQKWIADGTKKSSADIADLILRLAINGRSSFD